MEIKILRNEDNLDMSNYVEKKYVEQKILENIDTLFWMLYVMVKYRNDGGKYDTFFRKHNYRSVAIYGIGRVGEILCDYLIQDGIIPRYAIDQHPDSVFYDIDVLAPNGKLPAVDLIIVTVLDNSIKERILKLTNTEVWMLEDFMKDLLKVEEVNDKNIHNNGIV